MQCVEVKGDVGPWLNLCADAGMLLPALVEPYLGVTSLQESEEYSDYISWGIRQFPRSMRFDEGNRLVLAVQAEIEPAPTADPSLFAPPAGAAEWDWCDNAEPAQAISKAPPHYPDAEKGNRQQGDVSIYAVVRADGTLGDLAVVRSAGRGLDAASLASVRQWRYRPAMCGSKPIVTETVIDVRYRISE